MPVYLSVDLLHKCADRTVLLAGRQLAGQKRVFFPALQVHLLLLLSVDRVPRYLEGLFIYVDLVVLVYELQLIVELLEHFLQPHQGLSC